ncbi:hypothetical protein HanIR_Chr04g0190681 [Helianthus annuus]|nr:hypothetical protein HanIR_Chr04g0190681 [Helianthus annuus]
MSLGDDGNRPSGSDPRWRACEGVTAGAPGYTGPGENVAAASLWNRYGETGLVGWLSGWDGDGEHALDS